MSEVSILLCVVGKKGLGLYSSMGGKKMERQEIDWNGGRRVGLFVRCLLSFLPSPCKAVCLESVVLFSV